MTTTDSDRGRGELTNVRHLPVKRADDAVEPVEVLEGTVLTPEQYAEIQRAKAAARMSSYRRDVVAVVNAVKHERTKQLLWSRIGYTLGGIGVVAQRVWEAKTNSRYERILTRLEAEKDWDRLDLWECKAEKARQARHQRRIAWLEAPGKLAKATAITLGTVTALLLALGFVLALASKDAGMIVAPIVAVMDAIKWAYWLVTAYFLLIAGVVTAGTVYSLYRVGKKAEAGPEWLLAPKAADRANGGVLVTSDTIVTALRYLGISRLNEAIKKEGWQPRFELTPIREGQGAFKGYRAIFDLPYGVTPNMVADKSDVLAKNLHRNPVEVWPSDDGKKKAGKPGHLNLYVADSGVMDKPTPEYPLLHEGTADVFAGVPVGITQRGDLVVFVLFGGNFVFGGQPGQGKSNAARVVMLGAALDPLAELRVHVFANNGDFDSYAPRLSLYQKGATPEHVEMAVDHLRWMHEEVSRREQRLADLGSKKLTRALAEKHPDLRPIVTLFSECHELFSKSEDAGEIAVDVVKRGRKAGIICGFDTQSSRANAIPSQLVENVGINGCFAVKTWRSNDGFLGDGCFAAGIRATELRFNVDRGTMVATGVSDELFEIVRTFFVEVDDDTGFDAATEVIARAMAQLAEGTKTSMYRPAAEPVEEHDLLEDVAEALGNDPVPAAQVADALKARFPGWGPYQGLTGKRLAASLGSEYGVKVPSTGNKYPVDPVTVRARLAELATADLDDE